MSIDAGMWVTDDADLLLVQQFVGGDASAYDRLVVKYQPQVTGLIFRLLGWRADVDDVVQEVFLAALRGLPRFRAQSSVSTWLTTIALNKCRSYRRRKWMTFIRAAPDDSRVETEQRSAVHEPADQPLLNREKLERVRRGIDRLPARYREVIVLRYLEQMSIEQVAEVFGARPAAIQVRLHRARTRLRGYLEDLVED